MSVRLFTLASLLILLTSAQMSADEPVFSGPQKGEKLAPLKLKFAFGEQAGKVKELIAAAGDNAVVIVFFHERTRPAFNLSNAVVRFAVSRKKSGLKASVVWLTADETETTTWLNRVKRYFPEGVDVGISPDGKEGPGAYGLNRNVALTVLVGKAGKVTDNFALVQPSTQADGPKILQAIVNNIGGGEVPDINKFARLPRAKPAARPKPGTRPKAGERPKRDAAKTDKPKTDDAKPDRAKERSRKNSGR